MSASEPLALRRPARRPGWLAGSLSRAQQLVADLVLPSRLGHGVVSPREIDER